MADFFDALDDKHVAMIAKQPGAAVETPPARLTLDVALRTAWRGLSVVRGIHDGDYAAAGVSALGLAAVGRQAAGKEPAERVQKMSRNPSGSSRASSQSKS